MVHKVFNAGNIFGAISFLSLIFAPGAWEGVIENGGSCVVAVLLTVSVVVFYILSVRENGKRK